MATQEIPCRSDAEHFDLQVRLDGINLTLEFRWNARNAAWYCDVLTGDGEMIAAGRKVVVEWPLFLRGYRDTDPLLPRGELFAVDTSGAGQRPGRYDLGGRVRLYYLEVESSETEAAV